ncbi:ABC transporter ATP-binding protein [Scatolibacter rhodanostii]|uniref:ABC transporter ATP-binding protein n=1 Tax=Scatolibacter rhodanostii TaxID=2014781 RepID=UPI000C070E4C|nr:ATP-binding cassette domain-containing protein [Scatolibacter rhodanostii]
MSFISVKNVSKTFKIAKSKPGILGSLSSLFHREYEYKEAVKNISFELEKGEIVGYIGPNGAGKSTTIKMLSGILTPTAGSIEVNGIIPYNERKRNAARIGVVFGQRSQLYWDLPIEDTFEVYKKMYKIDDNTYKTNKKLFIDVLQMSDFMDRPVRQLSLGQKMKANLALSMLHDPDILYLDEPTIGLDVMSKKALRECILKINAEKETTIILTTHDMDDIESTCKRLILIDEGAKLYDGGLDLFKEEYDDGYSVILSFDDFPVWQNHRGYSLESKDEHTWTVSVNSDILAKNALIELIRMYDPINVAVKESSIEQIVGNIFSENNKTSNRPQ